MEQNLKDQIIAGIDIAKAIFNLEMEYELITYSDTDVQIFVTLKNEKTNKMEEWLIKVERCKFK